MQESISTPASLPIPPQQSSYRWVILALALSTFTMAFISKFAWPPLVPVIIPDIGITKLEAATYMSAFLIGYVITQIPGGILTDKLGPRRVLTVSLLFQGLGTAGLGFTSSYELGLLLRVACGLGAGFVYSACLKAVCSWFSPAQRGLAIGVVMCAPTIGVALPNLILPFLEARSDWQDAFKIVGLAIVILSVVLFALMRDIVVPSTGPKKSPLAGLKFVIGNRSILLVSMAGLTGLWTQIGFSTIGNDYLVNMFSITTKEAGMVMVAYGMVGMLMPALAGYLCDKFPVKQKILLMSSHTVMACSCFLFGQMTSLTAAVIAACFLGVGVAFSNSVYAVLVSNNTPAEWVATANGATNAIFQVGAVLSPLACGMAYQYTGTYDPSWWLLSGGALFGVFFVAMIRQAAPSSGASAEDSPCSSNNPCQG